MRPRKKSRGTPEGLSAGHPSGRKATRRPAKSRGKTDGSENYHVLVNAIMDAIRSIPRGRTAAYGQVAALAGLPRGARQVARVLHSLSAKQGLPWHRVINSNGSISLPMQGSGSLQARLLRAEGVAVDVRGRVDAAAGWAGDGPAEGKNRKSALSERPRRPKVSPARRKSPSRARRGNRAGGGTTPAP